MFRAMQHYDHRAILAEKGSIFRADELPERKRLSRYSALGPQGGTRWPLSITSIKYPACHGPALSRSRGRLGSSAAGPKDGWNAGRDR